MSNKTFTQKEIEVLRTSPYVQNVSQSMVFFSASFKEQFWKMLCDFDERLWLEVIDSVLVHPDGLLTFKLYDGTEVSV